MTVTGIVDSRSLCGTISVVTTLVYGKPGERPQPGTYSGKVRVHPEIELIAGAREGKSSVLWNIADLAVILLDEPALLNFPPIVLTDSEVKMGDALAIAGYGPTGNEDQYGTRRSGENRVTKILRYPTGKVIFGAAAPSTPDGGMPAHARPGDSGGACVKKDNPNVLIGIVTTGEQSDAGDVTSYFTSIYPYEGWLSQFMQADQAADAGVSAPGSDAGLTPSPQPATR